MKISKTKLHQLIREEAFSLVETPVSKTLDMYQQKRRQKRAQEKANIEDFFGDEALASKDTKTFKPRSPGPKPKITGADDPWGLKQIRQQRADAAAERGGTVPMDRAAQVAARRGATTAEMPPEDPDKTVAGTRGPGEADVRDDAEREKAAAKQATDRSLHDPKRISIVNFAPGVRKELLKTYSQQADITIDEVPLGWGEFGIVYKGNNPEYGSVAVKLTLSGQEINAYRNIKRLKDGLESREPEAGNVLPTILDIDTIVSPPVKPEGDIRQVRIVSAEGGEKYKVFVVQMELLEKLDSNIRSDIFGPAPMDEYPPEVRKRFVDEYLTVENIYSSLEELLGAERWEEVLGSLEGEQTSPQLPSSAVEPLEEGPTGRSIEIPKSAQQGSLPIKDARAFPPFREIQKILPPLRQAYLKAPSENHFFALRDIHKILATQITRIFSKYLDDDTLMGMLEGSAGYMLPAQMAANTRLPQYDPEAIAASPGLRQTIMAPSELQTTVAKNFYKRLKKLEKYNAQYGDVHANNVMMRENGDLVVADVGLFMFGKKGERGYAGRIAERFQQLAGLI